MRACIDRKSTRLNSSHMSSSYAVFCLKKKREEVAERGALAAEAAGERDGGKHLAARHGDAGIRLRDRALRLDEVRAAQQQLRGHARGQHRRTGALGEGRF